MNRDEKGRFTTKETQSEYGFYSKVLNKPFDTVEELKLAEEEYHKANDEKLKLVEVKKQRAKEVEDAFLELQKAREEADKILVEARKNAQELLTNAEKKYNSLRNAFAKDYNGYHMTYTNVDGKEQVAFTDVLNSFNELLELDWPFKF